MATNEQIQNLAEAKAAKHKLMTGVAVAKVNKDGMSVEYTRANIYELNSYIETLESIVNGVGSRRAPSRFQF